MTSTQVPGTLRGSTRDSGTSDRRREASTTRCCGEPGNASGGHGEKQRRYRSPLRDERAADTRQRIATAALELFAEHGFTATSVASIANRAGVSAQSVYAVYGTKGAVLSALLARLEDEAGVAAPR